MALTESQKRTLLIGGGVALVGLILFWSRRSTASTLPPAVETGGDQPVPGAGGTASGQPVFADPSTGTAIEGPSSRLGTDSARTVQRGESWSNMASRAYGDYRWWPYIWDFNRSGTQFASPDDLKVGDSVRIPSLPPISDPSFQDAIFARAAAHRAYWLCKRGGSRCQMDSIVYESTPSPA